MNFNRVASFVERYRDTSTTQEILLWWADTLIANPEDSLSAEELGEFVRQ